ncbi:MAG: hypothetical protein ACI4RA_02720 [Kiritimatiellia bacterium]
MKRMLFVCCFAMSGVIATIAAETVATNAVLVATAEVAPFGDVTKKVTQLGTMINNPIVPTLLVSAGQQQLIQAYGRFRSDSPMYGQLYIRPAVLEAALKANELDDSSAWRDVVWVYPSADGDAKMLLDHPGSTKAEDGTLHILAGEDNPEERWVKFTADGRYCAIASSVELANRAIADFAQGAAAHAARANTERPLLRLDIPGPALVTFASLENVAQTNQKKKGLKDIDLTGGASQLSVLRNFSHVTFVVDLDDKGLSFDCSAFPKPGVPPLACAGTALPAGALDSVPAEAVLFGAGLARFQNGGACSSEATFKANCAQMAKTLRTDVVAALANEKELKPYAALLTDIAHGLADCVQGAPYPAASDWSSVSLSFDAAKHPYLTMAGEAQNITLHETLSKTFLDRITGALERQWPGKGIFVKSPVGYVFDWAAIVDVAAAESGEAAATNAVVLATAKKTINAVLGGTKTELASKIDGTRFTTLVAAPGFKPSTAKPNGEARVAAALPEVVAARPGAAFYIPLYGFARDGVLPILAKQMSKKDAQQCEAMIAAMPPAEANSAIAGAMWCMKDGTCRGLVRITANEIKNYGAAFNAFTAASMASSLGDDDE